MTAALIAAAGAVLAAGAVASLRPRGGSRAARQVALGLLEDHLGRASAQAAMARSDRVTGNGEAS